MNNEKKLTQEQEEILSIKDRSLIVSASAGSGKTTIMIDKIADYILSQNCHIDELLVLTYTKAAAYEMKKKLVDKLNNASQKYSFIENELEDIQSSDICTFDSFCQKLIKKYFYILNIDPSFNILSEEDQIYIQNISIKNAIQQFQRHYPIKYETLLNSLAPKRNNDLITQLILNIYNYSTSILNPKDIFNASINLYTTKTAESIINEHYNNILNYYIKDFEQLKTTCANFNLNSYVTYISNLIIQIEQIKREPSLSKRIQLIKPLATLQHSKTDETDLSKIINAKKTKLKNNVFDKLYEHYVSPESIEESYNNCKILIENLFELFNIFEKEYSSAKSKINSYDFNDIERLTISLLENKEICNQIKNSYKYIFVDEFQDANAIQEKIIFMLQNNNLFFVGDTKQSIYAFRQSDPEIFLNIEKKFKADENCDSKTLNCNFRTNENILHFANEIFSIIMTPSSCGLNYAKDSLFTPMAKYDSIDNEKCVSLNLITPKKENIKNTPTAIYDIIKESHISLKNSKYDDECTFICNKILELLGQNIYDNSTKSIRPITYKDISILIAKRGEFSKKLTQHFINLNIPHTINSNDNLDDCYDNRVLHQLLKFTINQNDDYALTCLLTSPLFNFSDSELGVIKLNSINEKYFYNCVNNYNVKDNLYDKIKNFTQTIEQFAFNCKYKGIYYAFNNILRTSNYLLNISFEEDFSNRKQNIYQYINFFASSKYNFNISEYIIYKENSKKKIKLDSNKPFSDSVQITTMHSSKGLEYPIVILPNLDQDFTKEVNPLCIKINKHLGIGIKNFNTSDRKCSNGIFYEACKIKNKETELSEKIRLLYVAMTRAKNKLILIGKSKSNFSKFNTDFNILDCNNYLSMIVNCLDENLIEKINNGEEFYTNMFNNDKFEIKQINVIDQPTSISNTTIFNKNIKASIKLSEFLNKDFSLQKTNIVLKNSVSHISQSENASLNYKPKNFLIDEHLSEKANHLGTLYHKLLEQINFNEVASANDINDFIEYNFSDEEKNLFKNINPQTVLNNIILIKKLITKNSRIMKEQKFVMSVPYNQITSNKEITENILIQGIIDLLIVNDDNVILIDYKLTHKTTDAIKNSYEKQIQLYSTAISKQFNLPIKKYIINLYKSQLIEI